MFDDLTLNLNNTVVKPNSIKPKLFSCLSVTLN